jgi:hypothetical protein
MLLLHLKEDLEVTSLIEMRVVEITHMFQLILLQWELHEIEVARTHSFLGRFQATSLREKEIMRDLKVIVNISEL